MTGVSGVEFKKGEKPGAKLVVVTSSSADLTKEKALKSLGKKAERYKVQSFEKGEDKKGEAKKG